jgi:hypothetical protein
MRELFAVAGSRVGALRGFPMNKRRILRMKSVLAKRSDGMKLFVLVLSALAALLFTGASSVWADSVTIDTPFLFSGSGYDSNQGITHVDQDPWKGFVTLTVTNTGTQSWTDFHFGILSAGSDVSYVYFQGGTPSSTVPLSQWTANNNTVYGSPFGATLDLYFSTLVAPGQSATFTVYTDNTQDRVNFAMLFYPTVTPIPIPGAIWLLGSGLLGMIGLRRRFK